MMDFKLKFEAAKGMFFDRKKVIRAADKATLGVFSKFGAFVRQRAKTSIRKRKKPSAPGQPPSSHTGLLRNFIFFGLDRSKKSVVIGPVLLNQGGKGGAEGSTILPALEYGGQSVVSTRYRRSSNKKLNTKRTIRIQARPFMLPAFETEKEKLPSLWADSIK